MHWQQPHACITQRTHQSVVIVPCLSSRPAAARTRLRKLQHAAAADAAAAEANKERSPHAKPVYDGAEFDELVDKYQGLKWRMISKPGGATVKPDDFYRCAGTS